MRASSTRLHLGVCLGFLLGASFGLPVALSQESLPEQTDAKPEMPNPNPPPNRLLEVHNACKRAGVPVRRVFLDGSGNYCIDCDSPNRAQAEEIMRKVLARPAPGQTKVQSLTDALVVLSFEPRNTKASQLVRERYEQLREASLSEAAPKKR